VVQNPIPGARLRETQGIAPQVFQELLWAEGFTDIRYVDLTEAHIRRAGAANLDWLADMNRAR